VNARPKLYRVVPIVKTLPDDGKGKMAENRIPYFRFYPSDFMRGIRGLSAQEAGLYVMLLCRMYEESGPIENHALKLSTYCGMRLATFEKTLDRLVALGKITATDGMLFNDRAAIEISNRADDLKIASKAGKASAKKRQQNQGSAATTVQRPFNHTDTDTDTDKTEAKASDASVDFAKQLWDRGVSFLSRHGTPDKQARTLIGKWRKAYTDTDIFDAFAACSKEGIIDPVPWITAKLAGKDKPNGKSSRGEKFLRSFVAGAAIAPRVDFGEDCDPSQPLLARGWPVGIE
jgi:uncharacterized protein YdaU (DUF1376 family)